MSDAAVEKTNDIAELVKATRAATLASEDQNRIERQRIAQEAERIGVEQAYVNELRHISHSLEHCDLNQQRPILTLLIDIERLCDTILKLTEIIAARVIGERDYQRLHTALMQRAETNAPTVHVDIGKTDIELANTGDVYADAIAGRDIHGNH